MTPDPSAIRLLVLDCDGVLTDGSINIDDDGVETKSFNVRDGFGIALWRRMGYEVAIITGRSSRALQFRAAELGIRHLHQGVADKPAVLHDLLRRLGLAPEQAAYVGDDWPDLPAMAAVGYAVAPADAEPAVLRCAHFVTSRPGGRGCVRETVEHLLAAQNRLEEALRLHGHRPVQAGRPAPQ